MSSMRLPKFLIHKGISKNSLPAVLRGRFPFAAVFLLTVMFVSSCSKGGSLQSAGVVSGDSQPAGQQAVLPESGAGQAAPAVMQPSDSAGAVLARAEKTLPYPDRASLQKLDAVLASLPARTREGILLDSSSRAEFLTDLEQLLEEEKGFRGDDLSLFYLIDKQHKVGADYVPKDLVHLEKNDLFDINKNNLSLRPEAYEALCRMARASLKDGVRLLVSSTYRSYEYQKWLFQHWVDVDGLEEAERESARAGTSQHQLGVAVDFGSVSDDFADTEMGRWVYAHSEEYGWSLSFPQGYEDVTGFRWESWHFRYIGRTACDFQRKWFSDVQQFMIEFIDAWKSAE